MNRISRIAWTSLAAIVAVCAAGVAQADDNGWYLGASLGASNYGNGIDNSASQLQQNLTSEGLTNTATSNAAATGGDVFVGYSFNRYFALEGGYYNMGSATIDDTVTAPAPGTGHIDLKLDGWRLDAVGTYPMSDAWSLFARLGAINASVKEDISASGSVSATTPGASSTNSTFDLGVGVQFNTSRSWGIRLGLTQFHNVGDSNSTGNGNVGFAYVSALYRF